VKPQNHGASYPMGVVSLLVVLLFFLPASAMEAYSQRPRSPLRGSFWGWDCYDWCNTWHHVPHEKNTTCYMDDVHHLPALTRDWGLKNCSSEIALGKSSCF
jgi:hypothetical protein